MTEMSPAAADSKLLDELIEWAGFLCFIAFWWFVWPPATLAAAAVVLVATARAREKKRQLSRPGRQARKPLLERLISALVVLQGQSRT